MIICLSYSKGGVGKTTISANLVRVKNKKTGKRMDLFDLDSPQNGSYAVTLHAKDIGLTIIKTYKKSDGLSEAEVTARNGELIDQIIEKYKGKTDENILIDCGGHDSNNIRKVLLEADMIITPLSVSDVELNDFMNWNESIIKNIVDLNPDAKLYVLFNKYHRYEKKDFAEIKDYIESEYPYYKVLSTCITDRKDYRTSFGKGKGVIDLYEKNPARKEIEALSDEIYHLLEKK